MDIKPEILRAHCNDCGRETKHHLIHKHQTEGSEKCGEYNQYEVSWQTTYLMLECCGCEDVLMKKTFWFSENDDVDVYYYPPRVSRQKPRWFDQVPRKYHSLMNEIYTALHADSRTLSMMGLRALTDLIIAEKLGNSEGFASGLEKLVIQGHLTTRNKAIVEAAVDAGHAASHRAHVPSSSELETVMDIVENLIQSDLLELSAKELKKTTPKRVATKKSKGTS